MDQAEPGGRPDEAADQLVKAAAHAGGVRGPLLLRHQTTKAFVNPAIFEEVVVSAGAGRANWEVQGDR